MSILRYDARNMFRSQVGKTGARPEELHTLMGKLERAKAQVLEDERTKKQGWLGLPSNSRMMSRVSRMATRVAGFENLLVIGIGGSDLGARAALQALGGSTKKGMTVRFAGANTDPDELFDLLNDLDLKKTAVNIISKSGDTLEPMATFLSVTSALKRRVGKDISRHVIATTDEQRGTLREMADREGFKTLPVPENVGGRFSILSDVGLFPMMCAGLNIRQILKGAGQMKKEFEERVEELHPAELFAALQVLATMKRGQSIHVVMPYATRLREFGFWYRQLWAESLGKRVNRQGKVVNTGATPIAALGATDQHSQVQLYNEGPSDKTVTFIELDHFDHALTVSRDAREWPTLAHLSGVSFEHLIHVEREATAEALRANHRPNGTITLERLNPEGFGALILFFEIATAVAGELFNINTYDQPGVESGKKIIARLLGKGDRALQ